MMFMKRRVWWTEDFFGKTIVLIFNKPVDEFRAKFEAHRKNHPHKSVKEVFADMPVEV